MLADAVRDLRVPVAAVLGNHDLHSGKSKELVEIFRGSGIHVLDREATVFELAGERGRSRRRERFRRWLHRLAASGLRRAFAAPRVCRDDQGGRRDPSTGWQEIAHCRIRVVLLHYAPISDTLLGEPEGIWTYLGSDRLAAPIAEYRPDVVLHGHAHSGSFEGAIGEVPVYNVAVHVTGRDFYVFELEGNEVEVEAPAT